MYSGYGFIEKETVLNSYADLEAFVIPQKNTVETESIIKSYLNRNPDKKIMTLNERLLEENQL